MKEVIYVTAKDPTNIHEGRNYWLDKVGIFSDGEIIQHLRCPNNDGFLIIFPNYQDASFGQCADCGEVFRIYTHKGLDLREGWTSGYNNSEDST